MERFKAVEKGHEFDPLRKAVVNAIEIADCGEFTFASTFIVDEPQNRFWRINPLRLDFDKEPQSWRATKPEELTQVLDALQRAFKEDKLTADLTAEIVVIEGHTLIEIKPKD